MDLGPSGRGLRGQTSLGPLKMSLEMAHKVIVPPKKNYIPQFLKQRDINSYYTSSTGCTRIRGNSVDRESFVFEYRIKYILKRLDLVIFSTVEDLTQ